MVAGVACWLASLIGGLMAVGSAAAGKAPFYVVAGAMSGLLGGFIAGPLFLWHLRSRPPVAADYDDARPPPPTD